MPPDKSDLLNQAKQYQAELVQVRRHLHRYPELSFAEIETAKFVAERLDQTGYRITRGIAKTGLTADLGDEGSTTIAIRADMDALPIQEDTKTDYHSRNKDVMHACGHDAHVSCALVTAKLLATAVQKEDVKPRQTRFRMLMQPAEEAGDEEGRSGAYRMVEDGAMRCVDAVIGLHMDATLATGKIGIAPGPVMAAADGFKITIFGKGGHGAFPENTIDAVVLGAQVVQAIQQIVSRRISALDSAIITIGSFQSSSIRGNIISDHVELRGTVRTFDRQVRQRIIHELENACSIARTLGGDYRIEYEHGYPATINDPAVAEIMSQAAVDLIGAENVLRLPPKTWSEDFSMFAEIAPGAFMFLGCAIQGDPRIHHTANFDLDESALYFGPAILAETAKRLVKHMESKK